MMGVISHKASLHTVCPSLGMRKGVSTRGFRRLGSNYDKVDKMQVKQETRSMDAAS